jgi:protein-histidine pros-kinase
MGAGSSVIDRDAMLAELDGDLELLNELIDTMMAEAPKLLHEIRAAVEAADPTLVARGAHTLKGAVSNFGARGAADAALRLEQMGRSGELADAATALAVLEVEMKALAEALSRS